MPACFGYKQPGFGYKAHHSLDTDFGTFLSAGASTKHSLKPPASVSGLRERLFTQGAVPERLIYAARSKDDIFNDEWKCRIDPRDRLDHMWAVAASGSRYGEQAGIRGASASRAGKLEEPPKLQSRGCPRSFQHPTASPGCLQA